MSLTAQQRAAQRLLALRDLRGSTGASLGDHPAMTRETRLLEHVAAMYHARRIFEQDDTAPTEELARYAGLMRLADDELQLLCAWAFGRKG